MAERMDRDGDGARRQWGGTDCDDQDPARNDRAVELCNGIDDDCSGTVDDVQAPEGDTFYLDLDHDDVGGEAVQACARPEGTVLEGGDCDDDNALVNPGVAELCNGIDDDCDGLVDFDDDLENPTWYGDADGDGYGLDTVLKVAPGCEPPEGYAAAPGDCDDLDPAVNPDGTEVCNGYDDDCDELVDDADGSLDGELYYEDEDNDGFGDAAGTAVVACSAPFGHEPDATDCDDSDATVNPDAIEVCNGRDDNCVDDENDAIDRKAWYVDGDGDTYGGAKAKKESCEPPDDGKVYVDRGGDCHDDDVAYHPYADECGETEDYNCDGSTGKVDNDLDGYDAGCDDCNDADPAINPGATEECNDTDTDMNCNGLVGDDDEFTDPDSKTAWYPDDDGDHYGDAIASPTNACVAPSGTVADHTDCNDAASGTHPGAVESWYNGFDENCDELSDYDRDFDGDDSDSWGGTDCDDTNPDVYVGAPDDWYDGVDGTATTRRLGCGRRRVPVLDGYPRHRLTTATPPSIPTRAILFNSIDENCNGSLLY
jgi:hypothetical protein